MTPMPTSLLIALRDTFKGYFDEEGLKDFSLSLGVDYESISGGNKAAKARELALYLWRHSMLDKLAEVGPQERPDIDWLTILAGYVTVAPQPPESPSNERRVNHTDLQALTPILAGYPMFQTPEGRQALLSIAGVDGFVIADLNGAPQQVATIVLTRLNTYGVTADGDTALGRLLAYLSADPSLPPTRRDTISTIVSKYQLA